MAAPSFEKARKGYGALWRSMTLQPGRIGEANSVASKIVTGKVRYQAVEKLTGVPWYFIGLLHSRESSLNFNTYLGNGQPLNKVTTMVPRGRGPFRSFEAGAVDALAQMGYDKIKDWSVERILYLCEKFNGFGYYGKINSPYVWGGTNHQQRGKYVSDGRYDPNVMDTQLGCAAILYALCKQDAVVQQRINPPMSEGGPQMADVPVPTTALVDVKPWYLSKKFWGIVCTIVGPLLTTAIGKQIDLDPDTIIQIAGAVLAAFGLGTAGLAVTSKSVTPTGASRS